MAKFLPLIAAIASITPGSYAFTTHSNTGMARTMCDVRLGAKLEGRDIDGVLTPTNNFVLVKIADIQSETEGGIILTGSVSDYTRVSPHLSFFILWLQRYGVL